MFRGTLRLQLDVGWSFEGSPDEYSEWEGQWLAFPLLDGWGLAQELARNLHPGGFGDWRFVAMGVQNQGVGAIQNYARGVFEVVATWIDHCEIQARLNELENGVALEN
jgi:hypothetical protein